MIKRKKKVTRKKIAKDYIKPDREFLAIKDIFDVLKQHHLPTHKSVSILSSILSFLADSIGKEKI